MIAARSSFAAAVTIAVSAILIAAGCSDDSGGQGGEQMLVEKCEVGADAGATEPDFLTQDRLPGGLRSAGLGASGRQHPRGALGEVRGRPPGHGGALLPEQQEVQGPLGVRFEAPVGQRQAAGAEPVDLQHVGVLLHRPPLPAGLDHLLRGAEDLGDGDRALRHGRAGDDPAGVGQDRRPDLLRAGAVFPPDLGDGGEDRRRSAQERAPEDHRRRSTRRSTSSR